MNLPLPDSYPPMEAVTAAKIPEGPDWQYEPKWDGFRCLVFRDGEEVELQSKAGQPLARYFPELVAALKEVEAKKFILDGEIVISIDGKLSFDDLLQRIHPAASRIRKLSKETPATLIVFDLLADEHGALLADRPLELRRPRLDAFAAKFLAGHQALSLSPATTDVAAARGWLKDVGATLDGVVAKRRDLPYQSGERTGMVKIKNLRSADCVIGGFRYAEKEKLVGSLLLGLYDEEGLLNHVGFCSGLAAAEKPALTAKLEKLIEPPGFTGKAPGGPSRWSTERSAEWQPLAPELVVEVRYDHFTQGRFRHGTKLLRWRPDKAPAQCTMSQV
ncbi:MAG: ATP-dependent DNA ligase [Bryobacteraceae bacterium]